MNFHDFDKKPIAWREAGSGETIVFLHGMPGSRTSWDGQFRHFSSRFRCVAWDMPGYGGSDIIDTQSDFSVVVSSLRDFVENRLIEKQVHLVGLSLGGMIAMHAAAGDADFIRSITVLDASPCFGFGGGSDPEEFVQSVVSGLEEAGSIDAFCQQVIPSLMSDTCPPDLLATALASMVRASASGLELSARLIARHDIRAGLQNINVPSLIMAGEHDVDTPVDYGQYIAAQIPQAGFIAIPGAGHISNVENASFVNSQIEGFLTGIG